MVAARELSPERLGAAVDSLRTDGDSGQGEAALRGIAGAVLSHRLGGSLRAGEPEALRAEVVRLGLELAGRDGQIARLQDPNDHHQPEQPRALGSRPAWSAVLPRAPAWRAGAAAWRPPAPARASPPPCRSSS